MAFGNLEAGGHAAPMADINTTPMVDVMLVLLIIFMVCTPLMTQSVTVNLPKAVGAATEEQLEIVSLAIAADGALSWNGAALDDDAVAQHLTDIAAKQPQGELHLQADKDVRYERVAQVMAQVRAAGVNNMGFVMLAGASNDSH
jgi:biopolymer transport protein ExbD